MEGEQPPPLLSLKREEEECRTPSHLYAIKTLGEEPFKNNGFDVNSVIQKLTPHWWHFYFKKVTEEGEVKIVKFNYQMLIDLLTVWTKNPPPIEVLRSFKQDINFDQDIKDFGNYALRLKDIFYQEDEKDWDQIIIVSRLLYKFGSKFIFPVSMEQLKYMKEKELDMSDKYVRSYLAAIRVNPGLKKLKWRDCYDDFNWIHHLIKEEKEQELIKVLEGWQTTKVHPEVLEEVKQMIRDETDWYMFIQSDHRHMNVFDALLRQDKYRRKIKNERLLELIIIFGKFQLETDNRIDNYIRFGKMLERLKAGQRIARWAEYWMYDEFFMKPMPTRINLSNTVGVMQSRKKWGQENGE